MSIFKKSKDKIEAEKLYVLLSDKTQNYTLEDIKKTIKDQGYTDSVSKIVIEMITDNKLPLKKEKPPVKNTKEDILQEISQTVKKKEDEKKPESNNQEKKEIKKEKNLTDVKKVSFFKKIINFFKMIYFFFEDLYYKAIDGVSKLVPINKLTDKIDKAFPSFILFLIILALIIYVLCSGALSFSKTWTISVQVNDTLNNPLHNANVLMTAKDKNISSLQTDVFGEALFRDLKLKKQDIKLIVSKERFNTSEYTFKLSKNNIAHTVELSIDVNSELIPIDEDQEREILFVENNDILITEALNVSFSCTNPDKTPSPSSDLVTSGKIIVNTKKGCGSLRVSVTSNKFSQVTNKVVPENNKVNLIRINDSKGKLGVSVKNIFGEALSGADVTAFKNKESSLAHDILQTDIYGLLEFSLQPREYYLTATKDGYLTYPKKGPLDVIENTSTNTSFILFTADQIVNFDCEKQEYSQFCINNEIDCQNQHLKPFLKINPDGTCQIGTPGYIDVTLVDQNSGDSVFADITLESKLKNSDQNYSFTEYFANNTNKHTFNVIDLYQYRVRVLNSEENGYLSPDPVVVQSLDSNIIIELEFSSELNSGQVNVNVKDDDQNISNARVYLFRESEDGFFLVSPTPKLTNQFGDVNFLQQRAKKEYYAYALHNQINKEGISDTDYLDVNSVLDLEVNLESISRILNLKVTPNINYDINFYDALGDQVFDYVVSSQDQNKEYYFTENDLVYAILSYPEYTSYQTELISLIPGQKIFKEITLSNISACEDTKLELIGLYNKTGQIEIENIDYLNYPLSEEYKLKFKYTSCLDDFDYKKAHIRAGDQIFIDDDYLFFINEQINFDLDVLRGYKFSGEHVPDFNHDLFSQNYVPDRSYNYQGDEYKWVEIDFSDLTVNVLEFSLDFKFKEYPIAPLDFYNINYRSFAVKYQEKYSFDPVLDPSWNEIAVYPNGYFYSQTNDFKIPFLNTDYIYLKRMKDFNNQVIDPYVGGYPLDIGVDYKYDVEYLYLKENTRNGDVFQSSDYTNNNLEYKSYGYVSKTGNSSSGQGSGGGTLLLTGFSTLADSLVPVNVNPEIYYHIDVLNTEYFLEDVNADRGYYLGKYTLFKPNGFFENTSYSEPKIVTDILSDFPRIETNIYSYTSSLDYVFEINTDHNNNKIYIGENNVSLKVLNNFGDPVEDVIIKYKIGSGEAISLGETNSTGLINTDILIDVLDLSKEITFYFFFLPEHGFENNVVLQTRDIESGVYLDKQSNNLSANYYRVNGQLFIEDKEVLDYKIIKENDVNSFFEEITLQAPSSIFNINSTNNELKNLNLTPKEIDDSETEVITDFYLNNSISSNFFSPVNYVNEINFDDQLYQLLLLKTITDIKNLGNINYSIVHQPGFFIDSQTKKFEIELIKEINPEITLDFNLSSTKVSSLKAIDVQGSLPSFIDQQEFNQEIEEHLNQTINNQGTVIPLKFSLSNSFNNYPSIEEEFSLKFTLLVDEKEISFVQEFVLSVFDKDSVVEITSENNSIEFFCSQENCQQTKSYNFKKNVKHYNLSLLDSISLDPQVINLIVSINGIDSITQNITNRSVTFSSDYGSLQEEITEGVSNTKFNFSLPQLNKQFNLEREINYTIKKIDSLEIESNVNFDYCVGVGGYITGDDTFILGYCQEQEETCYTGEDYVPKVFFNWGEEPENWTSKCVGENLEDMDSKYACDSLQALISIFTILNSEGESSFFIKTLNDGVSDKLLKDFIEYIDNYSGQYLETNNLKPVNEDLFTIDAVDDGSLEFKVNKNNYNQTETEPAIYSVSGYSEINEPYQNLETTEKLIINLEYIRPIPQSELTVFHYLPFNGTMNKEEREDYGVKTHTIGSIIDISPQVSLDYSKGREVTLNVFNRNSMPNIEGIFKSDGEILKLEKTDSETIAMYYQPSYPIPLFSHAACVQDEEFSYNLTYEGDSIQNLPNKLFDWNYNGEIFSDEKKIDPSTNISRYVLDIQGNQDLNLQMTTMLYLPTLDGQSINNFKFILENYSNSENTKVFSKNNLSGNNNNFIFTFNDSFIGSDLEKINTFKGIFEYIKEEKACIIKSPQETTIKWIGYEFTEDELTDILNNIPEDFECLENTGTGTVD